MDRNEAFVNVLAMAWNEDSFLREAREALDQLGFDLLALEEPEPLRRRASQYHVAEELLSLAMEVETSGEAKFGTFRTWVQNDE